MLDTLAAIEVHGLTAAVSRQIRRRALGDQGVLHAYKKQRQKAPAKEIETAERRMEQVLAERG